jgi:hypothetical protein
MLVFMCVDVIRISCAIEFIVQLFFKALLGLKLFFLFLYILKCLRCEIFVHYIRYHSNFHAIEFPSSQ